MVVLLMLSKACETFQVHPASKALVHPCTSSPMRKHRDFLCLVFLKVNVNW